MPRMVRRIYPLRASTAHVDVPQPSVVTQSTADVSSHCCIVQALRADVDRVQAKKLAEKAHDASYLGQVMRGEKKMKRFLRRAGGEMWEDPSLAEWDPNDFRIFCGDLGKDVSDEVLARAFRDYPSFQRARVMRGTRSNKSKGYGFVSFKDAEDYVRAFREMDGQFVGSRPIKLRKSQWKHRDLNVVMKKPRAGKRLRLD